MKCPKCGSKMTVDLYVSGWFCMNDKCNHQMTYEYAARLDKALSKFTDNHLIIDEEEFEIYYYDNYFRIKYDDFIISLDTVEHLIADLERGNE